MDAQFTVMPPGYEPVNPAQFIPNVSFYNLDGTPYIPGNYMPVGGHAGWVLTKNSDASGDFSWTPDSGNGFDGGSF